MQIGITYNLRDEVKSSHTLPEDAFEEFDSLETINTIADVFKNLGHKSLNLGFGREALEKIKNNNIDFVFNIAEGYFGRSREAHMPALLEMLQIPFSGPDALTAALTLDKVTAKKIASLYEVQTPSFIVLSNKMNLDYSLLKFPAIVKPAYQGSSIGIRLDSKVSTEDEAREKISWLRRNYPDETIIIEEFISGPEVTVGVIGNKNPEVLGIMEIAPRDGESEDFIYSLEVKRDYLRLIDYYCPARLEKTVRENIEKTALRLYNVFGCRDISRFDFRLDGEGRAYFLEVNTLPGLNPVSSDIVIMSKLLNISYKDLISRILKFALERYGL